MDPQEVKHGNNGKTKIPAPSARQLYGATAGLPCTALVAGALHGAPRPRSAAPPQARNAVSQLRELRCFGAAQELCGRRLPSWNGVLDSLDLEQAAVRLRGKFD